ncbi:MAG: hypothetical protein HY904_14330 [Deltaproteobacteria bacterium]|nr:hypothetical protein [Deltaproteobacteria bacterium]
MTGWLLCALSLAGVPESPSMAVLPLQARTGVSADTADLVTSQVTTLVRDDGRLRRVIGTRELEAVLGFERQQELMACQSSSCLAQLAGALGVDFILMGSVGRLGDRWIINLSVVDMSSASVRASMSPSIAGASDSVLLEEAPHLVFELLGKARLPGKGRPPPPRRAAAPSADAAAAAGPSTLARALRVAGALGLGGGGVAGVGAAVGGVVAAAAWGLMFVAPSAFLGMPARGVGWGGLYWLALAASAAAVLVTMAAGGAGTALLVAGMVAP